jgi:hypothetical protein
MERERAHGVKVRSLLAESPYDRSDKKGEEQADRNDAEVFDAADAGQDIFDHWVLTV